MDIFNLGDQILALLEMVFGFWNNQISLVFSMLGKSPVNFKGGGPWAVIAGIEPIFVAVGSSLVVLFFVIGFCSESIDIREEMRFEVILRMLIRLGLAEWFVANNVTIMKAFFTSIGNLVNLLSEGSYTTLTIDSTQADIIKDLREVLPKADSISVNILCDANEEAKINGFYYKRENLVLKSTTKKVTVPADTDPCIGLSENNDIVSEWLDIVPILRGGFQIYNPNGGPVVIDDAVNVYVKTTNGSTIGWTKLLS